MAGEWIIEKARGLLGMFPGQWEEVLPGVYEGRCPGEDLHSGKNARTDCRIHLGYGGQGQPPGIYCLHSSCKGVLEPLNQGFREAIFAKDPNWRPEGGGAGRNEGVVTRPPRDREAWIPEFNIGKLRGVVSGVPAVTEGWFMERSPVDPRGVAPGEFLERCFGVGERVMVFTDFKGKGDFLWEVGKGGYRLSDQRGVPAVRSKLPVDGGKDGVWYLCNPVDGKWYPNARRGGKYSRRSMESVTSWRHLVLECDEEKVMKRKAAGLRKALEVAAEEREKVLVNAGGPRWAKERLKEGPEGWLALAERLVREAAEVPGLWMRLCLYAVLGSAAAAKMKKNEDLDKELEAFSRASVPYIFLDNVYGGIQSASIDQLLTSEESTGRAMGGHGVFTAKNTALLLVTGNRLELNEDAARRFLVVDLFEKGEPGERGVKDEEVLNDTSMKAEGMRKRVLSVLWALVRNWHEAGCPKGSVVLGSFEDYSRLLGGIVEAAGYMPPFTKAEIPDAISPEKAEFIELMGLVLAEMGEAREKDFTLEDLARMARGAQIFVKQVGTQEDGRKQTIKDDQLKKEDMAYAVDKGYLDQKGKSAFGKRMAKEQGTEPKVNGVRIRFGKRENARKATFAIEVVG